MTVQPTLFTEIFELWPEDLRDVHLARDMGVGRPRARQWLRRNFLPVWYWPELIDVVEQKFGRVVTHRELVEAGAQMRGRAMLDGQARAAETRRHDRAAKDLAKAKKLLARLVEGEERGEAA